MQQNANTKQDAFTIGLDFGSDSARALVVDAHSGEETGSGICEYPRWKKGMYCDPAKDQYRQHPQDHIDAMKQAVADALSAAGKTAREAVRGIGVDTTGSSPGLVAPNMQSVCETAEFKDDPNGMFVLWKDHCSVNEAEQINAHARNIAAEDDTRDYLRYVGGVYSSEWFWAKLMFLLRQDERLANGAFSLVEHCDWVPGILTGCDDVSKLKRSRCAAGHKALWHKSFGGLPPLEFFSAIEPRVASIYKNLYTHTATSDAAAGVLSDYWSGQFGLPRGVMVAVGGFDAHFGAVGAGIKPGDFVRVMGTSTCDIVVSPYEQSVLVKGICGQVDGSVIPGMTGYEAGQSSFGDIFAWMKKILTWSHAEGVSAAERDALSESFFRRISEAAARIAPSDKDPVALDWLNGRRTPDANQRLGAAVARLKLSVDAPAMYRAFAESSAFGARAILECFERQGVHLPNVVAIGGVAKKSDLVMQILADVLQREVQVIASEQCCALGSAIFGAVAAGLYPDVPAAIAAIASKVQAVFKPAAANARVYQKLYADYLSLGGFVETLVK